MIASLALPLTWPWRNFVLAVIHTLWQASIVAALLWIVLRTVPARYARLRYLASAGALGAIVFTGMITWSIRDRVGFSGEFTWKLPDSNVPIEGRLNASASLLATPGAAASYSPPPPASHELWISLAAFPWTTWAGSIWACGAALMLFRTLVRATRAQRWAAHGELLRDGPLVDAVAQISARMRIRRRIRLLVRHQWVVPAVVGFISPALLLPASIMTDLSADQLRMILAHELAHIRRWDYLVNFWQQIIEALLFFNPAVWWVSRQMRVEREACCDAWAVRVTGAAGEAARTLADFAQRLAQGLAPPAAMAITGGDSGSLLDRIRRIIRPNDRPAISAPWYAAIAAVAVALILLGLLRAGADVAVTTAQALLTPAQRIEQIARIQQAQQPIQNENQNVEVRGTVRTADGSPLPVHCIIWTQSRNQTGFYSNSVTISAAGAFAGQVQAGEVSFVIDAQGFAPAFAGPLDADATGIVPPVRIVLDRGFTARIRIVDSAGNPLIGVPVSSVYVKSFWVGQQKHKTDSDGMISLKHSTSQVPVQLEMTVPGFEFYRQSVPLKNGKVAEVVLNAAKATSGKVVGRTSGLPISGAAISLVSRQGFANETHLPRYQFLDAPPLMATSGVDGTFVLNTLRADCDYALWVSAPGHGSELFQHIHAGERNIVWQLGPQRVIRGRITGDLSKLKMRNDGAHPQPVIDVDYNVMIPTGDSTMNYQGVQTLDVGVAAGVGTFELTDPASGTLTFDVPGKTIRVDTNKIPPVVEIHLNPDRRGASQSAETRRTIDFMFDLPPGAPSPRGKFRVNYQDPKTGFTTLDLPVHGSTVQYDVPAPNTLTYQGDDLLGYWISTNFLGIPVPVGTKPLEVHIPVVPAGAMQGMILDSDGKPHSNDFSVSTIEITRSPAVANQPSNNQQPFNSQDSSGKFFVSSLPLGGQYMFVAASGDQIATSPVMSIDAQTPIRDITLMFAESKPLRITVCDAEGHSLPNVRSCLEFTSPFPGPRFDGPPGSTGPDGTVVLEHINPHAAGTYALELTPGGDYVGQKVPIQFDDKPLKITLARGYPVRGWVLDDKSGQPMANVPVTAIPYSPSMPMADQHRSTVETFTDENGHFAFTNLDQNDYALEARVTGSIQFPTVHGGQRNDVIIRVKHPPQ